MEKLTKKNALNDSYGQNTTKTLVGEEQCSKFLDWMQKNAREEWQSFWENRIKAFVCNYHLM